MLELHTRRRNHMQNLHMRRRGPSTSEFHKVAGGSLQRAKAPLRGLALTNALFQV